MTKLRLIDANNDFRRFAEASSTGLPLRNYFDNLYFSQDVMLVVFDGYNASAKRRAIYPGYKIGRQSAPDNFYIQLKELHQMLRNWGGVPTIQIPGVEADDVIATICQSLDIFTYDEIQVDSTDKDFLALANHVVKTPSCKMPDAVTVAADIRLYKTLKGDTSDKIPGLYLFADKSFAALTDEHKRNWAKCLDGDKDACEYDTGSLGLGKPSHIKNFHESLPQLRSYWQVVNFFPISIEEITKHIHVGQKDYTAANNNLKRLFQ